MGIDARSPLLYVHALSPSLFPRLVSPRLPDPLLWFSHSLDIPHQDVLVTKQHADATVLPLIYATPPDHSHYAVHNLALQLLQNDRVPGFLMAMLRHQICNLYAAHGVPAIRPGALPGMVCLWRRLFEYMNEALQAINNSLMQDNQSMPVLARIMEVMSVEVRGHCFLLSVPRWCVCVCVCVMSAVDLC